VDDFVSNAHRSFDFLVSEYGFTTGGEHRLLPELGDSFRSVRYDAPHLFVWVHLDPQDVAVLFFVKIHTSILRPSGPRSFELQAVLRRTAPGSLDVLASRDWQHESRTGFTNSLELHAKLLRQHCDALLRLDLKLLEQVASQR
jgi:hypothetical protein